MEKKIYIHVSLRLYLRRGRIRFNFTIPVTITVTLITIIIIMVPDSLYVLFFIVIEPIHGKMIIFSLFSFLAFLAIFLQFNAATLFLLQDQYFFCYMLLCNLEKEVCLIRTYANMKEIKCAEHI